MQVGAATDLGAEELEAEWRDATKESSHELDIVKAFKDTAVRP